MIWTNIFLLIILVGALIVCYRKRTKDIPSSLHLGEFHGDKVINVNIGNVGMPELHAPINYEKRGAIIDIVTKLRLAPDNTKIPLVASQFVPCKKKFVVTYGLVFQKTIGDCYFVEVRFPYKKSIISKWFQLTLPDKCVTKDSHAIDTLLLWATTDGTKPIVLPSMSRKELKKHKLIQGRMNRWCQ